MNQIPGMEILHNLLQSDIFFVFIQATALRCGDWRSGTERNYQACCLELTVRRKLTGLSKMASSTSCIGAQAQVEVQRCYSSLEEAAPLQLL